MPVDVQEHIGLVYLCVKRFCRHGMEYEELVREGMLALAAAATRFDPARGVQFSTYAVPCILHDLRRACERNAPMHIPSTERSLLRTAAVERQKLFRQNGQDPGVEELAQAVGSSKEALGAALAAEHRMEQMRWQGDKDSSQGTLMVLDQKAGHFVEYVLLLDVIARLPTPMPKLIELRYLQNRPQREVATALRISQAQVSKLEQQAKALLQERLEA